MNRVFSRLGLAAALVAGAGTYVLAQDATTGAISGIIIDPAGAPIAGARVILDGGRGQIMATTDAKGYFKVVSLIPGQYQITVTAAGYEVAAKRMANASINTLTPVRIQMAKTQSAVVEVVATSTAIDTTTQTSGSTFTSETVSSLPIGRSFSSVVNLAPGVASSGVGNNDNNPAVSGASGLENQYVIDGVNTTGTGYGANGSYSITYGSLGTGINTDFISEVQIKSFGMDAEFGGATGGRIQAVTKTGDNEFKGQIFGYFDIDSLQAKTKTPPIIDPSQILVPSYDSSNRTELGFTLSGPIIKDKLFYFVGYNPIRTETKRTQIDPTQGFYNRQITQKTQTDTYYAKLNWAVNTNNNLEASFFGDPGKNPYGAQTNSMIRSPQYAWAELEYGGTNASLKYNGVFFNDLLIEAQYSKAKAKFKTILDPQVNSAFRVLDAYNGAVVSPGPGFYERTDDANDQFNLKITKTFGDLELKAGYQSEKLKHNSGTFYQGPAGFVEQHPQANGQAYSSGVLVSQRYYVLNPSLIDANGNTSANNIAPYYRITRGRFSAPQIRTDSPWDAYFIQGKYSLNNRLFIKAGLRWEEEVMHGRNEDYKFKANDAMAPRISITLDPAGDGKNKIYAFYGKYFEKVPLDLNVRSLSQEVGVSRADYYNMNAGYNALSNPIQNGTGIVDVNPYTGHVSNPTPVTTHYIGSAGFLTPVLPGTKLPYQNEYVFGWDTQVTEGLSISNRIIYRSLGRVLEDMGIDGGNNLPYYIGNPGENSNLLAGYALQIDPTLAGSGTKATWPKPRRDYYAYEFDATYNSKHVNAFFNVRLSRLEGNYEGLFNNQNGQSDPNITSMYDFSYEYLAVEEAAAGRGLTGNEQFSIGPLSNDRAIIANAGFTYNWENGFSSTLLAKFQTGTPLSKLYGLIDYDNAGELPAGGRGGWGRTPNIISFDWSGQYMMKLRGTQRISFRADVFNLFNASRPTTYDQDYEASVGVVNLNYGNVATYQHARQVRLGFKYQF